MRRRREVVELLLICIGADFPNSVKAVPEKKEGQIYAMPASWTLCIGVKFLRKNNNNNNYSFIAFLHFKGNFSPFLVM